MHPWVRVPHPQPNIINNLCGEVSEWFKELVLKTSDSARGRGFESHPLRHSILDINILGKAIGARALNSNI